MDLLVITNLYPPQELGGYGRAMADFVWGLQMRGHHIQVLCNDSPHLGPSTAGPSGEAVERCLELKGEFRHGVSHVMDWNQRHAIDARNRERLQHWLTRQRWDGLLLGNLDLLGVELLPALLAAGLPVLHHIGFVVEPFRAQDLPAARNYRMVAASEAVRAAQIRHGFSVDADAVVYPGCRDDLLGEAATGGMNLSPPPQGTVQRPLKVGYAGLLMNSKGPHTLLKAVRLLRDRGVTVEASLAGSRFAGAFAAAMDTYIERHRLQHQVRFLGQLNRQELAQFLRRQHAFVFPSIFPEAFGIVAAEAMASGLALVSSGVGGASELFEPEISGLSFPAEDAHALAAQLERLATNPELLERLQQAGEARARQLFSVRASAAKLEKLFEATAGDNGGIQTSQRRPWPHLSL